MEEGPEPQELFEQVEHRHHEAEEKAEEEKSQFTMRSAITASILAVLASLGSLLAGHTANDAILKQTQATDQWSYYQAKSTKAHIFEGDKYVVKTLASLNGISADVVKPQLAEFDKRVASFNQEKEEIQKKAQEIQDEGAKMFEKHERYSLGVMFFQIAIVICSVSILVRSQQLYFGSITCGILGGLFVAYGFFF